MAINIPLNAKRLSANSDAPRAGILPRRQVFRGASSPEESFDHPEVVAGTIWIDRAERVTSTPNPSGLPRHVNDVILSASRPLDGATRAFMEPRFGHDFSRVRVHADVRAARSASAVNATAYTVGPHIVFGERQYAPDTTNGRLLLAHELAHVVQQQRGAGKLCSDSGVRLEDAAERAATSVVRYGGSTRVTGSSFPYLARLPAPPPKKPAFPDSPVFISESPALLASWREAAKGVLERELDRKFGTFEEAEEGFRAHLRTMSSSAAQEYADRMRDRVRKALWRAEYRRAKGGLSSFDYSEEELDRMRGGSAPREDIQLEHLEEVKQKPRPSGAAVKDIPGHPERALDPDNLYTIKGGKGGTAPKGTQHAEKWEKYDAAVIRSRQLGGRSGPPRADKTPGEIEGQGPPGQAGAKPGVKRVGARPAHKTESEGPARRPAPLRTAAGRKTPPIVRVPVARRQSGRGRGGSQSGSASVGALFGLTEAFIAVLDIIAVSYLPKYYEQMYSEYNDKKWEESLEALRPAMVHMIDKHAQQVQWWQEQGRVVTLLVALRLDWQDSGFGLSSLQAVDLTDMQLAAEGLPEPPLKLASQTIASDILNDKFGRTVEPLRIEFEMEGTRADVRRLREIGERLATPGVDERERYALREERDNLIDELPEDVFAPQSVREFAVPRQKPAPPPSSASARSAAITAKRAEADSLEKPPAAPNPEKLLHIGERLRAVRVELWLLELEERRGSAFDVEKRAQVIRLLQDVVFYEWKAERERLPANEQSRLNNLRHMLDEETSPP